MPDGAQAVIVHAGLWGKGKSLFTDFKLVAQDANVQQLNDELISQLKSEKAIISLEVEHAFRSILRHHFLPDHNWAEVYSDRAIAVHLDRKHSEVISAAS